MNSGWHRRRRNGGWLAAWFLVLVLTPVPGLTGEDVGVAPLLTASQDHIAGYLPPDTDLLADRSSIEKFLERLDGRPPDWSAIFGAGHHDSGFDERLFELNRRRDKARAGKASLDRRIAFLWSGELSHYDADMGGFRVALGPRFTPTEWGVVRFKYEDLPGNLIARPADAHRSTILDRIRRQGTVDIDVVMAGVLVPDESIVYDFSHEEEGLGLIMPVVRVEHLLYILPPGK